MLGAVFIATETKQAANKHTKQRVGDLVICDGNSIILYGHAAIISAIKRDEIEIIQQNPGPYAKSRAKFSLKFKDGLWRVGHEGLLGWLRKENTVAESPHL
jgi:hypothetical protein